jgi:hypothetical protein
MWNNQAKAVPVITGIISKELSEHLDDIPGTHSVKELHSGNGTNGKT